MMKLGIIAKIQDRNFADAIILPFWKGKKGPAPAIHLDKEFTEILTPAIESGDLTGKEGEIFYFFPTKGKEKRIIWLGIGEEEKITAEILRRGYGKALVALKKLKAKKIHAAVPSTNQISSDLIHLGTLEGLLLANYSFDKLKGKKEKEEEHLIERIEIIGGSQKNLAKLCERTEKIAESVYYTRDLVMGNAADVTPLFLSEKAKELQRDFPKVKVSILKKKELEKEKMGLLLAVGQGSAVEPTLIIIEYFGDRKSDEKTALIGKGVTFDTGGLNLKPTGSMEEMRVDMAGAAIVLGTIKAAANLDLKVNLIGVIPATENAIGPSSYKPGDVYRGYSGITVEISNTDAEGRLILADALSYVQKNYEPTRMIDFATLTGGAVVALGEEATALFSNDDELASQLIHAGEKTYERLWKMPLFSEYDDLLKSKIADIKNSGGKKASPITGAKFLQRFVKENIPWAHLDIAGTAFVAEPKPYCPAPATGVGIRLLIQYFDDMA
ncbi:MAG: leucyl aminopeptidase [Chlamydiae bacterium]|nr:leucyl aminopeptidase [Chlamydiota bacterium]